MASLLIWLMFFGVGVLWWIDGKRRKERALHAILSTFTTWLLVYILKLLFQVSRPFELNGGMPLTITIPRDYSFPSNHAAVAFSLAWSVFLHNKKEGFIFILIAFLVALGRVLGNVHSVFDVVVGAFIGIGVSTLAKRPHLYRTIK